MTEREQADELTLEAEVDLIHTQLPHDLGSPRTYDQGRRIDQAASGRN